MAAMRATLGCFPSARRAQQVLCGADVDDVVVGPTHVTCVDETSDGRGAASRTPRHIRQRPR